MGEVHAVRLERRLSLHHGVAIICGLVIGSGIYISPTGVVQEAGSSGLSLILWAVGGLISIFGKYKYLSVGSAYLTFVKLAIVGVMFAFYNFLKVLLK